MAGARVLLLLFFFFSGACGLVYEVVWTKMLTLAIGSTVYSISTVLVAFMGGIALGSYVGGRLIDRKGDPFLVYGILEGLIGIYCILVPSFIKIADPILAFFYDRYYTDQFLLFSLIRFVICVLILIFPTTLMGATLPVLIKFYYRSKETFGWDAGKLYALNTTGAVTGAFLSGFVLLRFLGQGRTILLTAGVNLTIAIIVILLKIISRQTKSPEEEERVSKGRGVLDSRKMTSIMLAVLFAYSANGFAGMAYQIAWTRALSLSIGSSTYSFSLILTVFILGLAVGAGAGARVVDRLKNPLQVFGWVEVAIGFTAGLVMWGLGRLPVWVVPVISRLSENYEKLLAMQFAMVGGLLLLPTFLMGTAFPLAVKIVSASRAGAGEPVGLAYSWNTAGAIAGSFFGGFVFIPFLGLQGSINASNFVNWLTGVMLIWLAGRPLSGRGLLQRAVPLGVLGAGILFTVLVPRWDKELLDSGPFIYAKQYAGYYGQPFWTFGSKQVFYAEDVETTVSVRKSGSGQLFLRINGKTDASTGGDMATQVLSGHLPLIFQSNPEEVLVIGLASGVTTGAVSLYPSIKRIDVVEISPAVVEACKRFFGDYNYNVLNNPVVNLIIGDGRNHLRQTSKKYDAIISEPSNPWIAGISSLFTREFFQSGKEHLKPGGAMFVWFHGYGMRTEDFRSIVRTFSEVFPNSILWEMGVFTAGDFGLLGFSDDKNALVECNVPQNHFGVSAIKGDLARVEVSSVPGLFSRALLGPQAVALFARDSRVHTDDWLFLEYEAPRSMYLPTIEKNLAFLLKLAEEPSKIFDTTCFDVNEKIELEQKTRANRLFLAGIAVTAVRTVETREAMISKLEASFRVEPRTSRVAKRLRDELIFRATDSSKAGKHALAALDLKRLVTLFPDDGKLFFLLGVELINADPVRNAKEALEALKKAQSLGYKSEKMYLAIAVLQFQLALEERERSKRFEKMNEAVLNYKLAIQMKDDYFEAWKGLGLALMEMGKLEESRQAFIQALRLSPSDADTKAKLELLDEKEKEKLK